MEKIFQRYASITQPTMFSEISRPPNIDCFILQRKNGLLKYRNKNIDSNFIKIGALLIKNIDPAIDPPNNTSKNSRPL